ncbi:MAG: GNAT family N-acetyltransferase [Candidatus Planktophila sp.]|nr:GNAT family N-acetyltransferase [Candidatus Planktophila sp.]
MKSSWPIEIHGHDISLRPLRFRDKSQWNRVRIENREWLSKWEATIPQSGEESYNQLPSFFEMVRILNHEARHGRSLSFAIWHGSQLVGQITLGGVMYGAMRGGHIGYWIDKNFANRGFTTQAVELLTQYAFEELKLHRIEINLRPENASSRRVAEKAGYVFEGERPRYLHIDGQWRDHITFVKENSAIK